MISEVVDTYMKIRFERYIELIDDKTGKLLDIGCGGGTFASFLDDRYDYYGIDISAQKNKRRQTKRIKSSLL